MTKVNLIIKYFIMKNLLNLGKALNKAEQKEVFGGDFGDVGLPDVGPTGLCLDRGVFLPQCICWANDGEWTSCGNCYYPHRQLPGFYPSTPC